MSIAEVSRLHKRKKVLHNRIHLSVFICVIVLDFMITQISNNTAYKRLYRLLYESPDKK